MGAVSAAALLLDELDELLEDETLLLDELVNELDELLAGALDELLAGVLDELLEGVLDDDELTASLLLDRALDTELDRLLVATLLDELGATLILDDEATGTLLRAALELDDTPMLEEPPTGALLGDELLAATELDAGALLAGAELLGVSLTLDEFSVTGAELTGGGGLLLPPLGVSSSAPQAVSRTSSRQGISVFMVGSVVVSLKCSHAARL